MRRGRRRWRGSANPASAARRPRPQANVKPKSTLPKTPQPASFELADSDALLEPPPKTPKTPKPPMQCGKPDSSDYDLTPAIHKSGDSRDDFSLKLPDDSAFKV